MPKRIENKQGIVQAFLDGEKFEVIEMLFDVSIPTIKKYVEDAGFSSARLKKKSPISEIVEYARNNSAIATSKRFNVTPSWVYRCIKKASNYAG